MTYKHGSTKLPFGIINPLDNHSVELDGEIITFKKAGTYRINGTFIEAEEGHTVRIDEIKELAK